MEIHRRYLSGTLSAILGPDLLPSDTWMRSFKLKEMAETSLELASDEEKDIMQAYSDGVNDFVQGVSYWSFSSTARLLPLEFIVLGITKENYIPFSQIDLMIANKFQSMSHTYKDDLIREAFRQRHSDLEDLVDEFRPFLSS